MVATAVTNSKHSRWLQFFKKKFKTKNVHIYYKYFCSIPRTKWAHTFNAHVYRVRVVPNSVVKALNRRFTFNISYNSILVWIHKLSSFHANWEHGGIASYADTQTQTWVGFEYSDVCDGIMLLIYALNPFLFWKKKTIISNFGD